MLLQVRWDYSSYSSHDGPGSVGYSSNTLRNVSGPVDYSASHGYATSTSASNIPCERSGSAGYSSYTSHVRSSPVYYSDNKSTSCNGSSYSIPHPGSRPVSYYNDTPIGHSGNVSHAGSVSVAHSRNGSRGKPALDNDQRVNDLSKYILNTSHTATSMIGHRSNNSETLKVS